MSPTGFRTSALLLALVTLVPEAHGQFQEVPRSHGKLPVTTTSAEARELFLEGRVLVERLHPLEARPKFERAVELDPNFALAHLSLANSAPTGNAFYAALAAAVAAAPHASVAERHLVHAADAGARNDVGAQRENLEKALRLFPDDERIRLAYGTFHFGRQEWDSAIDHLKRATDAEPDFAPAWNLLGYAYRFAGRTPRAERAFLRYIDLLPDEPNPHDSYAEFLMKQGRFAESIESYERALKVDPFFSFSYVGVANNLLFLDNPVEARRKLARLAIQGRSDGEKRLAAQWTAVTWVWQGETEKALEEIGKLRAIAEKTEDWSTASGDHVFAGDVLLEAGDAPAALVEYGMAYRTMEKAGVPADVKAAAGRAFLYHEARVAVAREDLETARFKEKAFRDRVPGPGLPLEVMQTHELAGRIAILEGNWKTAIQELGKANLRDPRVLHALAVAYSGAGDAKAKEAWKNLAEFNEIDPGYAFVRRDAVERHAGS